MKRDIFDLKGKVAIVTGGAGMLREYCRALAEASVHVVVADLRGGEAKDSAHQINANGHPKAIGIETDVTDKTSVEWIVARTFREFGRVDILVNNAALDPKFDTEHADAHTNTFEDYPLELWNQSIDVDLTGSNVFLGNYGWCCACISWGSLSYRCSGRCGSRHLYRSGRNMVHSVTPNGSETLSKISL